MNILVHLVSISLPPPRRISRSHVVAECVVPIYLKEARKEMWMDNTMSVAHRTALTVFEGPELKQMFAQNIVCSEGLSGEAVTDCFKTMPELNVSRMRYMLLEAYRQRVEENADVEKTPAKFVSAVRTILPVRILGMKGIVCVCDLYV